MTTPRRSRPRRRLSGRTRQPSRRRRRKKTRQTSSSSGAFRALVRVFALIRAQARRCRQEEGGSGTGSQERAARLVAEFQRGTRQHGEMGKGWNCDCMYHLRLATRIMEDDPRDRMRSRQEPKGGNGGLAAFMTQPRRVSQTVRCWEVLRGGASIATSAW
jgi:hypothetical protein